MAFLIPLLVVIIGATISFGLFFYQANTLQQAVDVAAMEISRMPFSATAELGLGDLDAADTTVMYDLNFQAQIYDEKYLVIHDSEWDRPPFRDPNDDPPRAFQKFVEQLPLLNRLLVQVMVRDNTYPADDDPTTAVTRFPGTVVTNNRTNEETVLIPMLTYDESSGAETIIRFIAPVEEIRIDHDNNDNTPMVGPFSVVKPNDFYAPLNPGDPDPEKTFVPGLVALRINYPAQSATLVNRTGRRDVGGAIGTIVGVNIVQATAENLNAFPSGTNYTLVNYSDNFGPHAGAFGLGRGAVSLRDSQGNLIYADGVRPYRKVLSVQAIYRREVFQ